jgi:hypothetical protein
MDVLYFSSYIKKNELNIKKILDILNSAKYEILISLNCTFLYDNNIYKNLLYDNLIKIKSKNVNIKIITNNIILYYDDNFIDSEWYQNFDIKYIDETNFNNNYFIIDDNMIIIGSYNFCDIRIVDKYFIISDSKVLINKIKDNFIISYNINNNFNLLNCCY